MDESGDSRRTAGFSDYLAAERTLLAWIRTGLALMGFGFVVARFGLFLQQLQVIQHSAELRSYGLSLWFGTALIGAGVAVSLLSAWHHMRLARSMDRGEEMRAHSTTLAVATAIFLALVGLGMAIYLISVRNSSNSQNSEVMTMAPMTNNGILSKKSNHSVHETLDRLKGALQAKGVTLFAIVDHSGEAAKVGLKMRPTKLAIFGNPKGGTPLMVAAPSIAIDLPLKILISEDAEGKVWISYNSPAYLQERHGLPPELVQKIAVVEAFAAKAGE
ncbi:MAG: DUF302 domain-containing protein [Candidatus Acidiferrales bacterium]